MCSLRPGCELVKTGHKGPLRGLGTHVCGESRFDMMPGYYLIVITVTWKDYHGKRGHFNDRIALCVRGGKGIQPRVRPLPPSVELRGEPEGFKYRRLSSCQIIFSRQRGRQSWVLTGRGDLDSTTASHSSGQGRRKLSTRTRSVLALHT